MPGYHLKLPIDVSEFVTANSTSENYGLSVEKAGRFKDDEGRLEYMSLNGERLFRPFKYNDILVKSIQSKQANSIQSFVDSGYTTISVAKMQTWRMALGLGEASAYNNGFTFHKVYGIPYIPGQAIQGMLRNYIITDVFESSEEKALEDPGFCYLFGKGDKGYTQQPLKGKLIFLDAFPNNKFKIEPDVMNPHYGQYYGQQFGNGDPIPPADWLSPIPIFFLTLKEAAFPIHVLIRKQDDEPLNEKTCNTTKPIHPKLKGKEPTALIQYYLSEALAIHGIGAKTAVGYGRLTDLPKPIEFEEGQEVEAKVVKVDKLGNWVYFKIEGNKEEKSIQPKKGKIYNYPLGSIVNIRVNKINEDGSIRSIKL